MYGGLKLVYERELEGLEVGGGVVGEDGLIISFDVTSTLKETIFTSRGTNVLLVFEL